ncbi:hypothetical protein IMG5_037690 [Ichthyophthirius multifiliis]|uniref:Transmembrane protein n=1 Tax=Ichthyophthirius multifiliis TaxID=5932 RepID=G0QLW3_ICHMU|nr:hypothetical protein IMG5_037690 [Ichthyophthirius multifiliis]EGR33790.1 hypothetical protein IMG5_037690 [Ichthyophthirius multifiliis]|eukprot:XP_004039014.1 hypothetical protein IMG5_037690 [Ichthyophthirius multifiliis]
MYYNFIVLFFFNNLKFDIKGIRISIFCVIYCHCSLILVFAIISTINTQTVFITNSTQQKTLAIQFQTFRFSTFTKLNISLILFLVIFFLFSIYFFTTLILVQIILFF